MTELSQKRLSSYVIIKLGYFLSAHSVCFLPNIEIWMVEVLGLCLEEDISLESKSAAGKFRKRFQNLPCLSYIQVPFIGLPVREFLATSTFHRSTSQILIRCLELSNLDKIAILLRDVHKMCMRVCCICSLISRL